LSWLAQLVDLTHIGGFFAQFEADMHRPAFWLAVGKIVWINVLLSGDNALVIAMACRGLHGRHRLWGMVFGATVAVVLRIAFTGIVATLMVLPFLKLVGGLALLVIAAKLLVPEDEHDEIKAGTTLWHAVRIVVIADIVMSLDNVIAVAAAAEGQLSLLVLGLASSIPMIVAGAAVIMLLLDRFPVVIWLGAMLLGWIAGEVIASDPVAEPFLHRLLDGRIALTIDGTSALLGVSPHISLDGRLIESLAAALGAMVVLVAGTIWRRSRLGQLKPEVSAASVQTAEQPGRRSGVH
jgi:YjbE family integral membrane protein